jgi:hypothetical protein
MIALNSCNLLLLFSSSFSVSLLAFVLERKHDTQHFLGFGTFADRGVCGNATVEAPFFKGRRHGRGQRGKARTGRLLMCDGRTDGQLVPKSQVPSPKSQVPSPKSQVPSPKSQGKVRPRSVRFRSVRLSMIYCFSLHSTLEQSYID